jgi:hypothetical protein
MSKPIAPPSRYWAVQKEGTTVQRHETVAEKLGSLTFVIPDSCHAEQMSERELRQETPETDILSDVEKAILGV